MLEPKSSRQNTWRLIRASLAERFLLWGGVAVAVVALAAGYALTKPPVWQASQGMLIRDEDDSPDRGLGKFESVDAMQTAQETIFEVARSHAVLEAALKEVGPDPDTRSAARPTNGSAAKWPQPADVAALREAVSVEAPQGAEFGRTEVIYLRVEAPARERALALTDAVCRHLEQEMKSLRRRKAEAVIAEMLETANIRREEADAAQRALRGIEQVIGADLGELRSISGSATGESNLRSDLARIEEAARTAEVELASLKTQIDLLGDVQDNPLSLMVMTGDRLTKHPELKRLRDGLAEAQLRTAQLRGSMHSDHPKVRAAIHEERHVREALAAELINLQAGLESDAEVTRQRIASLGKQREQTLARLDRLAELRSKYSHVLGDVEQKQELLKAANQGLAAARASLGRANSASLITRVDQPRAPDHPEGPSRAAILAAGIIGGPVIGIGLVLLITPLSQIQGRRFTDLFRGRRSADFGGGVDRRRRRRTTVESQGRRVTDYLFGGRREVDRFPSAPWQQQARLAAPPADTPPSSQIPEAPLQSEVVTTEVVEDEPPHDRQAEDRREPTGETAREFYSGARDRRTQPSHAAEAFPWPGGVTDSRASGS